MKRRFAPVKAICLLVLCVFLLQLCDVVSAKSTTLSTSVPSQAFVELYIKGQGIVQIDNIEYAKNETILVDRHKEIVILFEAATGFELKEIMLDGVPITKELSDRQWCGVIVEDSILTVTFERVADTPLTGEQYNMYLPIIILLLSFLMILVVCKHEKRRIMADQN